MIFAVNISCLDSGPYAVSAIPISNLLIAIFVPETLTRRLIKIAKVESKELILGKIE
jgi:hypothetical protein